MGMYTEIKVECDVRADGNALTALRIMFDPTYNPSDTVKSSVAFNLHNRFFTCPRWTQIGNMSSAYFDTPCKSSIVAADDGVWRIRSVSNLKNYDGEIDKFFDWLRPLVVGEPGQVIGHQQYETEDEPTLVRL
jgi:hypothetical protein